MATRQKKKFIAVRPKTKEAEEIFHCQMMGLQSCELIEKREHHYVLKPIRYNHPFLMKIENDENWEIEK